METNKFKYSHFLSKLDIFGINYFFRVDNKDKHVSAFGGIMTVLSLSLCFYFSIFKFLDYLKHEDIKIQYINKFEKDIIITNHENFHLSLFFNFNYKGKMINIKGSEFEKYFTITLDHTKRFRNGKKIIKKIKEINCTDIDLAYNFPKGEKHEFLNGHYCFDFPNNTIYGQFSDESMSYYQASLEINNNYLKNQTVFNEVRNLIIDNSFRLTPYYSNKNFNITNLKDTVINRIDSITYCILSWYNSEAVNYFFHEVIFTKDLDPFFNNRKSESNLKFSSYDKIIDPARNRTIYEPNLIKLYIRPELKTEEIIVIPKKAVEFISDSVSIIILIMRFFGFFVPLFNDFQGKQKIISKTSKIDENLKNFHNSQILELIKLIKDDKINKNINSKLNKDDDNNKNNEVGNLNDSNNNDKVNINNEGILSENKVIKKIDLNSRDIYIGIENDISGINLIDNKNNDNICYKNDKINNIDNYNKKENYSNKKESQKDGQLNLNQDIELKELIELKSNSERICFKDGNNNNIKIQNEPDNNNINELENQGRNNNNINELENQGRNNNNINILENIGRNNNNINELENQGRNNNNINLKNNDKNYKAKKNQSRQRSIHEKEIIDNLKKNKLIKVDFLDYICIKLFCNKKSSKYNIYKLLQEKFNYNNDIIFYQNMSNEFEIFRKIFLRNDLDHLMNFLSKPTLYLKDCKKEKVNNNENDDNNNNKIIDLYISKEIDLFKIMEIYPDMLKNVTNNNFDPNNNANNNSINNFNNYDFVYSSIVEMFKNEVENLNK